MHDALVDSLASTSAALSALPPEAWERRPSPDEWSIADVIGHIRAADAIWRHRILLTLAEDGVTWPDIDERVLQSVLGAGGLDMTAQVTAFAFGRAELCGVLASLDDDGWARTFTHSTFGTMTVLEGCHMVIAHEAEHMAQILASLQ